MPKKLSKHVKAQETIPVPIISNDSKKQKIYEKLIKQYDAVFKVLAKNQENIPGITKKSKTIFVAIIFTEEK